MAELDQRPVLLFLSCLWMQAMDTDQRRSSSRSHRMEGTQPWTVTSSADLELVVRYMLYVRKIGQVVPLQRTEASVDIFKNNDLLETIHIKSHGSSLTKRTWNVMSFLGETLQLDLDGFDHFSYKVENYIERREPPKQAFNWSWWGYECMYKSDYMRLHSSIQVINWYMFGNTIYNRNRCRHIIWRKNTTCNPGFIESVDLYLYTLN